MISCTSSPRSVGTNTGLVGVEDLHVKGLIRNRCLSRSFSDAALGKLLDLLESKVPHAGGTLVKVDRYFPSRPVLPLLRWQADRLDAR